MFKTKFFLGTTKFGNFRFAALLFWSFQLESG